MPGSIYYGDINHFWSPGFQTRRQLADESRASFRLISEKVAPSTRQSQEHRAATPNLSEKKTVISLKWCLRVRDFVKLKSSIRDFKRRENSFDFFSWLPWLL